MLAIYWRQWSCLFETRGIQYHTQSVRTWAMRMLGSTEPCLAMTLLMLMTARFPTHDSMINSSVSELPLVGEYNRWEMRGSTSMLSDTTNMRVPWYMLIDKIYHLDIRLFLYYCNLLVSRSNFRGMSIRSDDNKLSDTVISHNLLIILFMICSC